ncbi:hypothetical protein AGMMS49940_19070 [Spirochaetia bacterium]|nr:hypothetical protein AGMMS49940_19070 [Spirochaetia bacterium]
MSTRLFIIILFIDLFVIICGYMIIKGKLSKVLLFYGIEYTKSLETNIIGKYLLVMGFLLVIMDFLIKIYSQVSMIFIIAYGLLLRSRWFNTPQLAAAVKSNIMEG